MGTRKVNLDGGEPLVHKHVDEIVRWLIDRGVSTRINTNGILVPKKIETIKRLARVKISLDGLKESHDAARGKGAFDKAIAGALAARDAGVPSVEFTCVVGRHNADGLETLVELVEKLGFTVIFQPARNSLFLDTERDGSAWQTEAAAHRAAFAWIERRKHTSKAIANSWSSLRHFRAFPADKPLPCSAGWIEVTMDPEGNLYHCGHINRNDRSNNVVQLGVRTAFARLPRVGCSQGWCARTVEGNDMWGGRIDLMLPPLGR